MDPRYGWSTCSRYECLKGLAYVTLDEVFPMKVGVPAELGHSSFQFQFLPPLKTPAFISLLIKRLASGKWRTMA